MIYDEVRVSKTDMQAVAILAGILVIVHWAKPTVYLGKEFDDDIWKKLADE